MSQDQSTIDKLFRDLIRVYSSSATSLIGLNSIQKSIDELNCDNNILGSEILKLSDSIKNTQPRMFPLDNLMYMLDKEIKLIEQNEQLTKKSISNIIETFKKRLETDLDSLINNGLSCIANGDFIVIHSIEENIEHLIPQANKMNKKFKILVLKQDIVTTGKILQILSNNQIEFEVVPEYDLLHFFDKITKLFIGAQALSSDNKLICDPGTSNIVNECHLNKIPIYLFLKTLKFSHYPASEQNIRKNSFQDKFKDIEYNYSIHSNDIINLNLINHIITDKGEITLDDLSTIREQVFIE